MTSPHPAEIGTDAQIYEHPTHPYTQALLGLPLPHPVLEGAGRGSTEIPVLAIPERFKRQDTLAAHESACHFAEKKQVVPVW